MVPLAPLQVPSRQGWSLSLRSRYHPCRDGFIVELKLITHIVTPCESFAQLSFKHRTKNIRFS
uniref:Uncharacterized protein n=1 Tax=Escherichia coli O157:H7 TaxID=83334 RepID=C4TIG6_ECO57|nr:predicted protein [Escherichia coli O157:H7]